MVRLTLIERSIDVGVPIGRVWPIVGDVRSAASCLPGLIIDEALDARTFKAVMSVQVGLLCVRYAGTLAVHEIDDERRKIRFRVDAAAPGGLTLNVGVSVVAAPQGDVSSTLAIVNNIALDPLTSLFAGPMIGQIGGLLLDGFSRRIVRLFD